MSTPTLEELADKLDRLIQRVHGLEAKVIGLSRYRARPPDQPEDSAVLTFTRQRCKVDPKASIAATELWEAYRAWCSRHRLMTIAPQDFAREVRKLGVKYERRPGGGQTARGISL